MVATNPLSAGGTKANASGILGRITRQFSCRLGKVERSPLPRREVILGSKVETTRRFRL
jgi:hypothetical protein